jgi:UDP-N-acetylmuramyl pentapeptide phosphotransferase/UDP-N-acetylglucosamine-1-phosphate transferase
MLYLRVALYYGIVDRPNERSSHSESVIRGGGIIFVMAFMLWSFVNGFAYPYLLCGVLMVAIISFIDDIKSISSMTRFGVHVISIGLLLFQLELFQFSWWLLPLFILLIGIENAYNFMDGINGITGFYSLVIFIPIWVTEHDDLLKGFIGTVIISLLVFLFFNARKKAKCFAGDIGSISIALMLMFVLVNRIIETNNFTYILMLLFYGIDSIFTIVQRLLEGENIFKAHRKHLYQYLVNELKMPHLLISVGYSVLQLFFNIWLLAFVPSPGIALVVSIIIGAFYIVLKFHLVKQINNLAS